MTGKVTSVGLVLGYGSIGRYHAGLLAKRYPLISIIDTNESLHPQIRQEIPGAKVASSIEELQLRGWDWDHTLAVIATWGPSHADLFNKLVRLGVRHILCEKPLSNSVEAGSIMVATAEELGVSLGTHHWYHYAGLTSELRSLAEEFDMGQPQSIVVQGGACGLVTNGLHYIHIASELFQSRPETVVSTASAEPINPRSNDLMFYGGTAIWSFPGGAELTISFSNRSSVNETSTIFYRNGILEFFPEWHAKAYRRVASEIKKFPSVTRTGSPSEICFKGRLERVRTRDQSTILQMDEIDSGEIQVFPPALSLEVLGACIGAITSGAEGRALPLPIDPHSKLGQAKWPIS